jgi:hypothetical protein
MVVIELSVEYLDGRVVNVRVLPVTQVAFERHFKMAFGAAFQPGVATQMEYLYWVAWHAARTGVEFDEWMESIGEVGATDDEAVDPTNPAASVGQ